jgi:hypothetical protein
MSVKGVSKNDPDEQIVRTKTEPRCAINMRRLVKRRRKPSEIPSRSYAIYNRCRECRGWEGDDRTLAEEVAACRNTRCRLWPVRCKNASEKSLYRPSVAGGAPTLPTKNPDPDISTIKGQTPSNSGILRRTFDRARRIPDYCAWCQCLKPGESLDPIRRCCSPECWLYPWRTGKLDVETYEPETLDELKLRVEAESKERGEER